MGLFAFSEDYKNPKLDPKPVIQEPKCELGKPEPASTVPPKSRKSKTLKPQPKAETGSPKEVSNDVSV
jgi:hypothetical protein